MASQVERVFYGSNQVPGQQLSREDIKQLRFRIKRDDGTTDNVVFDPLVGQDLYMACLKFFKNYSHGSNPTEVGHYEVGNTGASGSDFDVEINNQEIFLFREDDLVLTDAEFDRLNADLIGWTPVALRSTASDDVQHQWLYLSRSPDNGIRFICIEDTKARIAVIAPDSPHNIAISDAFDTSLFELKSNKVGYIDPTIDQSGNYLGGSAVNDFVEKRTFAISVPYGVSNDNTFTKILEYNELYSSSTSRGALFARLKIQFVDTYLEHRLREVDAYIGYDLYNKKPLVTFGSCYKTVYESDYDLKNLHIVTYDSNTRCHIEVYLEHRKLTSMRQWISVEVCENFQIVETSYGTRTSHSNWKIPLTSNHWDMVNGASIQPTAVALPATGVLKTDSYIIQSGNQVPFTYMPFGTGGHEMAIAKLASDSSHTKLVFKLYCKREGWVAIGKVERENGAFKLSFSAISDQADFEAGVALPYIYLSLLDGVYYVNLNIDSYHTVLESIAIEVENEKKDWEFFGSTPPDGVGTAVSGTDTYMKASPTAEVIDQGTNVPAPTSSTKVLTKQVDATGREFWKTEQMSSIPVDALKLKWGGGTDGASSVGYIKLATISATEVNGAYAGIVASLEWRYVGDNTRTGEGLLLVSFSESGTTEIKAKILVLNTRGSSGVPPTSSLSFGVIRISGSSFEIWGYVGDTWSSVFATVISGPCQVTYPARSFQSTAPTGYSAIPYVFNAEADGSYINMGAGKILDIQGAGSNDFNDFNNESGTVKVSGTGDNTINKPNWPLSQYYSVYSFSGGNDNFDTQLALSTPRVATDPFVLFYRAKSNGIWKTWNRLPTCGERVQGAAVTFLNASANYTCPNLNSGEEACILIRNGGSGSITVTAGALTRTLSPTQHCYVFASNGAYVQIS